MEDDNKLSFFFLGLGLGVAAGILFAPKAGSETRELIKTKANEGAEFARRQGGQIRDTAGDLVDRGRSVLNRQKDTLNDAMEAGKQAYRETVGSPADRNIGAEGV